ncbi:hypothetical protein PRUPE_1G280500 [Prunus persica]|uniref:Uncharacterized protein n=1 Tax=Prunus persica TaxID=3760 RepID=A0A251R5C4_PRUPE|nr:hypothetical protein PRUPE_1G280500 [Prunus persica]
MIAFVPSLDFPELSILLFCILLSIKIHQQCEIKCGLDSQGRENREQHRLAPETSTQLSIKLTQLVCYQRNGCAD